MQCSSANHPAKQPENPRKSARQFVAETNLRLQRERAEARARAAELKQAKIERDRARAAEAEAKLAEDRESIAAEVQARKTETNDNYPKTFDPNRRTRRIEDERAAALCSQFQNDLLEYRRNIGMALCAMRLQIEAVEQWRDVSEAKLPGELWSFLYLQVPIFERDKKPLLEVGRLPLAVWIWGSYFARENSLPLLLPKGEFARYVSEYRSLLRRWNRIAEKFPQWQESFNPLKVSTYG
jgi:hypothetical protein